MYRLFSTFPDRGLGLLLLRAAVGVAAMVHGYYWLSLGGHAGPGVWVAGGVAVLSGVSLVLGFLTRIACGFLAVGATSMIFRWLPGVASELDDWLTMVFVVVVMAAIILLGPGSWSIDARLFGRREIIIPRGPRRGTE